MPSHHRIKNIDYDDDDFYDEEEEEDDYYEEDQNQYQANNQASSSSSSTADRSSSLNPDNTSNSLTPEDRDSLRNGTAEVRQLLGVLDDSANSVITDGEIWSALWEFYYDVDASVEWLRESAKKRTTKTTTKTTATTTTATATTKHTTQKNAKKQTATVATSTQVKSQKQQPQKNGFGSTIKTATAKDVTSSMKNLHITKGGTSQQQQQQQQPPALTPVKIKHKGLNVTAEYENALKSGRRKLNAANFVVIGHVDAGKSTLMGRLLLDLKTVTQRQLAKNRTESSRIGKNSFALAWFLDSSTEEREHGVTIDVASTQFATDKTVYTLLDAPGHKDFVPNMIAGAALADFAILVIDASIGGFEKGLKGQTKEHALLVRSLGVRKVVVAINKMDASSGGGGAGKTKAPIADAGWSRDRYEEIEVQTRAFLTSTVGFADKNVVFVPCSGWKGQNVVARQSPSLTAEGDDPGKDDLPKWYTGPTLLEMLETVSSEVSGMRNVEAAMQKDLRMTIVDVFRGGVQNPISVSGRLDQGVVQIGDRICAMPTGATAVIKGIDVEGVVSGKEGTNSDNNNNNGDDNNNINDNDIERETVISADWAVAGDNVILHLANLESPSTGANTKESDPTSQLRAGDILCPASKPIPNVTTITTKVLTFAHLTPMHVTVHRGRLSVPASITKLVAVLDKGNNGVVKRRPKIVAPGVLARVQVTSEVSVPLEKGGRVVLRAEGETVAAGLIE